MQYQDMPMEDSKGGLIVVDYMILIMALIFNLFSLNAIIKTQFGLTSYRILLISLAASDLFLSWVLLVYYVSQQALPDMLLQSEQQLKCVVNFLRSFILFGVFANLYNLIGMSFDHFLGIVYPLRYRYMVNKAIARLAVVVIWILAFFSGFADIPILAAVFYDRPQAPSENSLESLQQLINDNPNCTSISKSTSYKKLAASSVAAFRPVRKRRNNNGGDFSPLPYSTFIDWESLSYQDLAKVVKNKLNTQNSTLFAERPCGEEVLLKKQQFLKELEDFNSPERLDQADFCSFANSHKVWLELFAVFWTLASFAILAVCYGRIFKLVVEQRKNRSIRKLIVTTCLLLGIFALCWLPIMVFEITMWAIVTQTSESRSSDSLIVVHNLFSTMFLLHPLLNPIIYVARLPNVQRSIVRRYGACLPCCRKYVRRFSNASRFILSMANSVRRTSRQNVGRFNSASLANNNLSVVTIDAFDQAIENYGNPDAGQANQPGSGDMSCQESLKAKSSIQRSDEDEEGGLHLLPIRPPANNHNNHETPKENGNHNHVIEIVDFNNRRPSWHPSNNNDNNNDTKHAISGHGSTSSL